MEGGAGAGRAKTKTPAVESEVPVTATEIAALAGHHAGDTPLWSPREGAASLPHVRNSKGWGIVSGILSVVFWLYGSPRLDHNLFRRPVLAADSESC